MRIQMVQIISSLREVLIYLLLSCVFGVLELAIEGENAENGESPLDFSGDMDGNIVFYTICY